MDYRKYKSSMFWLQLLSVPFVWLHFPFILILDLVCVFYQFICFPIYKIDRVKRSEYILIFDRNKLSYLSGLEKLACMYCGYANGVLLYMKEVASRTEKYWCGIMHEDRPNFKVQNDQIRYNFSRFGDEQDFQEKYGKN